MSFWSKRLRNAETFIHNQWHNVRYFNPCSRRSFRACVRACLFDPFLVRYVCLHGFRKITLHFDTKDSDRSMMVLAIKSPFFIKSSFTYLHIHPILFFTYLNQITLKCDCIALLLFFSVTQLLIDLIFFVIIWLFKSRYLSPRDCHKIRFDWDKTKKVSWMIELMMREEEKLSLIC